MSCKPLPHDKIFDKSKFKAFADDKIEVTQNLKFAFGRMENIVRKGENAGLLDHPVLCFNDFEKKAFRKQWQRRRKRL